MPVSCGTFKVTSDEAVVFNNFISFSHQLTEVPVVHNVYTIYPSAGEVWALYSKFRFDLTCSDLKKCEYNIVEVIEVVDVHWIIVSVLQRVTGLMTVFKAKDEGLDSVAAAQGMASCVAAGSSILDHWQFIDIRRTKGEQLPSMITSCVQPVADLLEAGFVS
ncbi:hypothetical protein C5167_022685 [Papaver somniferum]|uniref:DUF3444 domain-containing protein n=1 Tax=Papaver somniferum TaxID=3469 RepID=A0A4Y7JLK4_PAPSO|nr:hypothetical protein C5167_022685 [Papaver somniferum]